MVASVSRNGSGTVLEEMPYRWSQRWHDDPPIGTIVLGHEASSTSATARGIARRLAGKLLK
jgi:hypothetical protein